MKHLVSLLLLAILIGACQAMEPQAPTLPSTATSIPLENTPVVAPPTSTFPASATATPLQPTSTASTCLDEHPTPETIPVWSAPLEVRFISAGNIWIWEEGKEAARQQISTTGDAVRLTFSPDGQVIVFERAASKDPTLQIPKMGLWTVNRDGSQLRQLVNAEQFDTLLDKPSEPSWAANLPTDYRWLPGTHQLTFGVYPAFNALGWSPTAVSYWMVDTTNLKLTPWPQAEKIDPNGPQRKLSPDGRKMALIERDNLSLYAVDGSVILKNALHYTTTGCNEGGCWTPPITVWMADSQALRVLVWNETQSDQEEIFNAWEVSTNGRPARQVGLFKGRQYFTILSPNAQYIAYLHPEEPTSIHYDLHLDNFDGSRDVVYTTDDLTRLLNWLPDSKHFLFDKNGLEQPWLGSLCGPAQPLLDPADTPASEITWLDAARFLYIQSQAGDPGPLRLGQINGPTLHIGPENGEIRAYEIK